MGRVLRPHGLRGEVRVMAFSQTARNLQRGRPVFLDGVRRTVERARQDGEQWIVQLAGLSNRNAVETYRGELLEAADSEVLRDDDESYFVHELIGLKVVTVEGEELGVVTEVLQPGGNDVYVVVGDRGEVLIPAVGEVIDRIDVSAGLIAITPLPGMVDETA
ncbi:MAG TPA: ribosome maturation factor RimM [Tepidiformaceae bacterium]|nr:ribosome maturation factor RimM [Tepidiformaceae bacterium]